MISNITSAESDPHRVLSGLLSFASCCRTARSSSLPEGVQSVFAQAPHPTDFLLQRLGRLASGSFRSSLLGKPLDKLLVKILLRYGMRFSPFQFIDLFFRERFACRNIPIPP
jgi:hypothetical protein